MKRWYDEDLMYTVPEQHDSYIWDIVREQFENPIKQKTLQTYESAPASNITNLNFLRSLIGNQYSKDMGGVGDALYSATEKQVGRNTSMLQNYMNALRMG